jgi:hypothetical protein
MLCCGRHDALRQTDAGLHASGMPALTPALVGVWRRVDLLTYKIRDGLALIQLAVGKGSFLPGR